MNKYCLFIIISISSEKSTYKRTFSQVFLPINLKISLKKKDFIISYVLKILSYIIEQIDERVKKFHKNAVIRIFFTGHYKMFVIYSHLDHAKAFYKLEMNRVPCKHLKHPVTIFLVVIMTFPI